MRRSTLVGVLLLTIAAIALPWPASAETRIALVVGNSAYPSGPLGSPKDDAKAIEAKLKVLGFQVIMKTDLGYKGFIDAIREFGDRLQQPGTVGLFYYSGHAMQVNNRNYMIPTDADIRSDLDVELVAVPVNAVLMRMELGKSNPNFVILDACRNNPFEKRFKSAQDGLAQTGAPAFGGQGDSSRATLIAYAAEPGRVAKAGSGGKLSPYTEALVAHIDRPYPTYINMFFEAHNAVDKLSKGGQRPHLDVSPGQTYFSFKPIVDIYGTLDSTRQEIDSNIERLPVSQSDKQQLRAGFGSLYALIQTAMQIQTAMLETHHTVVGIADDDRPAFVNPLSELDDLQVGLAAGDIDSMVGPEIDSLQAITTIIEGLLAKGDLSADESNSLQWLMVQRTELSVLISQIFSSAHESRNY